MVKKKKEQLTIQSTPHQVPNMVAAVLWHGHVWLPMERPHCCLLTVDRSSKMNSEVFKAILSAHIQPNAIKLIGTYYENNSRLFEGKEMEYSSMVK